MEYSNTTYTVDNGSILRHLNFATKNVGDKCVSLSFGESWDDCLTGKYTVEIDKLNDITPEQVWEVVTSNSTIPQTSEFPLSASDGTSFSCQLRCPTCRDNVIKYKEYEGMEEVWEWVSNFLNDSRLKRMMIGCHGEPLYNKHRLKYLRSLTQEVLDEKESVAICTNGLLFTPSMWRSLTALKNNADKVNIRISLDAANKKTFAITRPTANWSKLLDNIKYLAKQNIGQFALDFTIQTINFREMVDFSKLAKSLGCDSSLRPLYNWYWDESRFNEQAVWQKSHPLFPEFKELLQEASETKGCYSLYQLEDYLPLNYWEQWEKQ